MENNKKSFFKEFAVFLKEYRVVSLAIAFIIGEASTGLVNSFVKDILLPLATPLMSAESWKEAVFTMKLEPELRAEFMAEAEAAHRPASQVLRELMRDFVQRQREAREYDEFLRGKVEAGRASMRAGRGRSSDEVEARFAARRASMTGKA